MSTHATYTPAVGLLLELAIKAGREILSVYATDFDTIEKTDGSPVTVADRRAEAVIEADLKTHFSDVPLVAEEAVEAGNLPELAETYFLVDPLDGTKEFIKKNGEFTVNIAVIHKGEPVFGVVYAPALEDIYWGGSLPWEDANIEGAFQARVEGDTLSDLRFMSVREAPESGLTVVASRSHLSEETAAFIDRFNVADRVSVGSSLKLCLLASGKADLYPRLAPTMFWDIGAGDAVVRAAGGVVLRADSLEDVRYIAPEKPVKADFKSPFFIAVTNKNLLEQAGLLQQA